MEYTDISVENVDVLKLHGPLAASSVDLDGDIGVEHCSL